MSGIRRLPSATRSAQHRG